jgi:hypothetical protein
MDSMFKKRTETIQFNAFMSGGYKTIQKREKRGIRPILKGLATSGAIVVASKVLFPAAVVSIPVMMLANHAMASEGVPDVPEVVPVGAIPEAAKQKIIHAFDPLIDLMVSLSLPIAGVMITGGALMIMIGMKDRGYSLILSASLGYVLVQMSPFFIDLLAGVGGAL